MLIRTDEKSVTLTPFGSLGLGSANASRGGGQSWDRNSPHGAFSSYPKPFRKPAPSGLAFAPGCRRFAALDPMWRAPIFFGLTRRLTGGTIGDCSWKFFTESVTMAGWQAKPNHGSKRPASTMRARPAV